MGELRNKTIVAIFWTTVESGFLQLSRFFLIIILARLLSPSDFGLIAMISVFIVVGEVLSNSGFTSALIRKKDITQIDFSTAFYSNILISFIIYFILFFSAGYIATFYNEPKLELLIRVVSLNIIFDAFAIVQNAIAVKKINFRLLTIIQVVSVIISGLVGVILAYNNYGVWALVFQSLINNFSKTALLWILQGWKPLLGFSVASFKYLFGFGINIMLSNLIDKIFMQLNTIVIGKFYSAADLGLYSQGKRIQSLPSGSLNDIVRKVSYPVFSKIQDDDVKLKMGFKMALKTLVFLNLPLMIWLMVVSKTFILVILTEKWLPAVPYLQLLCIVGILTPFNSLNINIVISKGFPNLALRLEFFKKAIMIIAVIITVKFGIIFIIIGEVLSSFFAYLINSYYPGKLIKYSILEQVKDVFPYLLISLAMAAILLVVKHLFVSDNLIGLIILAITGITVYLGLAYFTKLSAFLLVADSFKKLLKRG